MELNISKDTIDSDRDYENWLVWRSPHPVIYGIIAYLYFVLHLGPQLMKNRPAFSLNRILVGYNLCQVIFNLWMCLEFLYYMNGVPCITTGCCVHGIPKKESRHFTFPLLSTYYWFSKVMDLLDTVFFVLRKKFNQVTFLHLYHHVSMVLFFWFFVKYSADTHAAFIGIVNTFVHVVMYMYYLIAALGTKYQKLLWWKKYVTWLQLTQFGMIQVYLWTAALIGCGISTSILLFFSVNDGMFMLLFWNFYRKVYKESDTKISSKTD